MRIQKEQSTGEGLVYREAGEIQAALSKVVQMIHTIYDEVDRFSASREAILEGARVNEENEEAEALLLLLSDGVAEAEGALLTLGEELARLTEELADALWYVQKEECV